MPTGERKASELGGKLCIFGFQAEAARCADTGLAVGRPFGVVADDPRRAAGKALEHDLGDGQNGRARRSVEKREIELAAIEEAFGEILRLPERSSRPSEPCSHTGLTMTGASASRSFPSSDHVDVGRPA